jgi:hypothetical protein
MWKLFTRHFRPRIVKRMACSTDQFYERAEWHFALLPSQVDTVAWMNPFALAVPSGKQNLLLLPSPSPYRSCPQNCLIRSSFPVSRNDAY